MHLHYVIAIFTLPYYYIYNNFFSVIYWTKWYNLRITQDLRQIYAKFSKTNYKFFLWIPNTREIYIKLFTNVNTLFTNLQVYKWKKGSCTGSARRRRGRRHPRARTTASGDQATNERNERTHEPVRTLGTSGRCSLIGRREVATRTNPAVKKLVATSTQNNRISISKSVNIGQP
jgi:hypothetical protein